MTFHEVNTRIDQPMEHDIHRGIQGEYHDHVPWVDRSLYSPKLEVINWIIICTVCNENERFIDLASVHQKFQNKLRRRIGSINTI